MVEHGGARCFPAGWNVAPKPCDSCKSAAALLFCRKETVFLCMACDVNHTRHERVWMCELCEQSPAFVTCKADAAALCVTCDRDIHAANPLAKRHERIPVDPFYVSAEDVVKITAGNVLDPVAGYGVTELNNWGIPAITTDIDVEFRSDTSPADMKPIDIFSDINRVFDFGFAVPTEVILGSHFHDSVNDGVVPVQRVFKDFPPPQIVDHQPPGTQYAIDFPKLSTTDSYNKNSSQSHGHSVSSSSINTGVVPEQIPMLDISNPFLLRDNVRSEQNGGTNGTHKATSTDRIARVLRYREKRKNRKFEKKIRYASRKAYAEKRPRIKGRFVKRTELTTELDADRWLFTAASSCNSYGVEVEYGVVPSF